MHVGSWGLYTGIVVATFALGIVIGVILQRRCAKGRALPAWADVPPGRRATAVVLALLAIATVLSSMLTSVELRNTERDRRAAQAAQNACVEHLLGALTERTLIVDANHRNTSRFIAELSAAIDADGLSEQVFTDAAERYARTQDELDDMDEAAPIIETTCP